MSIEGLNRLEVWKKAIEFAVYVHHDILPLLPTEEKWVLTDQLRRASQSVPANIAEGYGRYYYQDNIRFCYIARGSLEESLSHVVFAHKVNYISPTLFAEVNQKGEELVRLINGYIAYLKQSKRGENEPGANLIIREAHALYNLDLIESSPNE